MTPQAAVIVKLIKEHFEEHPVLGLEIGLHAGSTTAGILASTQNVKMIGVDPWMVYDDGFSEMCKWSQERWDGIMACATQSLAAFGDRAVIWRTSSEEAANLVIDGALDFVFIDGDHSYEAVKRDIGLWKPKIRQGGLLIGHDYGYWPSVNRAVDESIPDAKLENAHVWWSPV